MLEQTQEVNEKKEKQIWQKSQHYRDQLVSLKQQLDNAVKDKVELEKTNKNQEIEVSELKQMMIDQNNHNASHIASLEKQHKEKNDFQEEQLNRAITAMNSRDN